MVPVEPPRPSVCEVHIHGCSVFTRQGFVNPDPIPWELNWFCVWEARGEFRVYGKYRRAMQFSRKMLK